MGSSRLFEVATASLEDYPFCDFCAFLWLFVPADSSVFRLNENSEGFSHKKAQKSQKGIILLG
jgi:hypothetical protein